MPELIQISSVHVTQMVAGQMTPVMAQSGVSWYQVSLTVRNRSDHPIHVMTNLRGIRYDANRRVLILELCEEEKPSERPLVGRPPPPARYRAIGPNEEATITHPLSSPITFLDASPDGTRRTTYVRLGEDVDAIECTMTYERQPPQDAVDLTAARGKVQAPRQGTMLSALWKQPSKPQDPTSA